MACGTKEGTCDTQRNYPLELAAQTEAPSGINEEGRDHYFFGASGPLIFYAGVLRGKNRE